MDDGVLITTTQTMCVTYHIVLLQNIVLGPRPDRERFGRLC